MLKFSHNEKHAVEDLVRNIGKLSLGGLFIVSSLWAAQALAEPQVSHQPVITLSLSNPMN